MSCHKIYHCAKTFIAVSKVNEELAWSALDNMLIALKAGERLAPSANGRK